MQSKRAATAHDGAAPHEYEHHAAHDIVLSSSGDRGVDTAALTEVGGAGRGRSVRSESGPREACFVLLRRQNPRDAPIGMVHFGGWLVCEDL